MINLVEKNDANPVCPHCKNQLFEIWFRALSGLLGKRYVYFCPQCRGCLGVSHRKGFWMG